MNIDLIIIFKVTINPLSSCSLEIESTTHFYCTVIISQLFDTLLSSINEVLGSITNLDDCTLVEILLYGDKNYTQVENAYIINAAIKYLVDLKRFNGPLL